MTNQRFQEILEELGRFNFDEVLSLTQNIFRQQHTEEALLAYFEITLRFEWGRATEEQHLEAGEVLSMLKGLSEETVFCLSSIGMAPVILYQDDAGKEQAFNRRASIGYIGYDGDIQPHWQELHYRLNGGKEKVVPRSALAAGCEVEQTPEGPLMVYGMGESGLSLALGAQTTSCWENQEYLKEEIPGVSAAVYYNHEEFPALWSWLYIDHEIEGEDTPWYRRHHTSRDVMQDGMVYLDNRSIYKEFPLITVKRMNPRSISLLLDGQELVLDKPNQWEVIWQEGKHTLKAQIYVPGPHTDRMTYLGNMGLDPIPAGARTTFMIYQDSLPDPVYMGQMDVRTTEVILRPDDYNGIFWNWPSVWGFIGGKLILGVKRPTDNDAKFLGLLEPGKEYTFPIDDYDRYSDRDTHYGKVVLSWVDLARGFEIEDGELMSVPDQKEIAVPADAVKMNYQSLLTAPSLRRIVIHKDVTSFSYALERYHRERGTRLDVVYEGTLQDWFNLADSLSGHIGRLTIQGKEYNFYNEENLVIPEGITSIGGRFFQRNQVLRNVVLPPEVVSIGNSAFAYCENLETVKVLGPADIGSDAFVSCHSLTDIYLADGVVSLGTGCFSFLTRVKSIFIPASVKKVGRLSSQNDGSCLPPAFLCAAKSRPEGWDKEWNLAYYDPRFGLGCGYDYYHPVKWGCHR